MLTGKKIGFIGGGSMAEALIRGMTAVELIDPQRIYATALTEKRRAYLRDSLGVQTFADNMELVRHVDIIFLTVKPQVVDTVMNEVGAALREDQLLISLAAGVATHTLENTLFAQVPIIRVMPNTPVLVREGAAAMSSGRYATQAHAELVSQIFSSVGRVVSIQEGLMDAVTGLSGSGPAYACMMIEALADGGVRMGLTRSTA
jgi:pyrroline-5-carboxylate reductase